MPKTPRLKETLRKKSTKSVDLETSTIASTGNNSSNSNDTLRQVVSNGSGESVPKHTRSISTASVMPGGTSEKNPWDDEVSISSPIRGPTEVDSDERGRAQDLDVPQRNERSVSEKPTRRRKKTLNQLTPHRFELVDAKRDSMFAKPPLPNSSQPVTPTGDRMADGDRFFDASSRPTPQILGFSQQQTLASVKPRVPKPPKPPRQTFSKIMVSASIRPKKPRPPPAPEPQAPPPEKQAPPPASPTPPRTNGKKYDFIGDFGLGQDDTPSRLPYSPTPANNPFQRQHRSSTSRSIPTATKQPYLYRAPSLPHLLSRGSLLNKVVLITNGTSTISQSIIRALHHASARVFFSSSHEFADRSRSFIRSLGPPDTVHFNTVDLCSYASINALFQLSMTMYGRMDHVIYCPGDDGGHARGIGAGERLWGLDTGLAEGRSMTAKSELEFIEKSSETHEGAASSRTLAEVVSSGLRFARIAVAYLRNSPGRKQKHATNLSSLSPTSPAGALADSSWDADRSLTFITSTAAITPIPYLPVYSASQHALLGTARSLGSSINTRSDGLRVNSVITNMMLPSVIEAPGGGRMSVQLPGEEKAEDIASIVAGLIANKIGDERYEDDEGEDAPEPLHGKILYPLGAGAEAVDVQDGLNESEAAWLGVRGKEVLDKASGRRGLDGGDDGDGGGIRSASGHRWMLMDAGLDSPTGFTAGGLSSPR